jgi:hypothetical protein
VKSQSSFGARSEIDTLNNIENLRPHTKEFVKIVITDVLLLSLFIQTGFPQAQDDVMVRYVMYMYMIYKHINR